MVYRLKGVRVEYGEFRPRILCPGKAYSPCVKNQESNCNCQSILCFLYFACDIRPGEKMLMYSISFPLSDNDLQSKPSALHVFSNSS